MADPGVSEVATVLEQYAPFLEDGTMAQDIAMTYALPYHSTMMSLLWGPVGSGFLLLGLSVLVWRALSKGGFDLWQGIVSLLAVILFAWPVSMTTASQSMFHTNYATSVPDPDAATGPDGDGSVALGVVFFMRVVNVIESTLYDAVGITVDQGGASPMAMFQAMSLEYYKMFEEEELLRPILDYSRNCSWIAADPENAGIDPEAWDVYALNGIPTFGRGVSAGRAAQVYSATANSTFVRALPRFFTEGVFAAYDLLDGEGDAGEVRGILERSNPMQCLDCPINDRPYKILNSEYWSRRARAGGNESRGRTTSFLSVAESGISNVSHPADPNNGTQPGQSDDYYATNCFELWQIADKSVEQMILGSESGLLPNVSSSMTPLGLATYGATTAGVQRALTDILGNTQANRSVFGKVDPTRFHRTTEDGSYRFEPLTDAVSFGAGVLRDVGIWAKIATALPDALMMTIGGVAIVTAVVVILLPVILLAGFISTNLTYVAIPIKIIVMLKLTLLLMYIFMEFGSDFLTTVSLYWTRSMMIGQTNVYPVMPLMYAAHNGALLLALGAPGPLAYMLVFGSTNVLSRFAPSRVGSANLAAGAITAGAAARVAGTVVSGGKALAAAGASKAVTSATPAAGGAISGGMVGGGWPGGPAGALPAPSAQAPESGGANFISSGGPRGGPTGGAPSARGDFYTNSPIVRSGRDMSQVENQQARRAQRPPVTIDGASRRVTSSAPAAPDRNLDKRPSPPKPRRFDSPTGPVVPNPKGLDKR